MLVHVITIFPELIEAFLRVGMPRIACEKGKLRVEAVDLRSFADDLHRSVDDRPYGGGPGMVMMAEPILKAVEANNGDGESTHRVLLTPQGRRLDQRKLRELANKDALLLLCGRYEGIDERVRLSMEWDEVSIGDYVLSGGEVAAMVLLDGLARLQPGVLGHPDSNRHESFETGLLEGPQYTRPRVFRGHEVPEVLLSGNHAEIDRWRHERSLQITRERRADLLEPPHPDTTE
jgi:tRNA (guanine37-N1)-methyltransferase